MNLLSLMVTVVVRRPTFPQRVDVATHTISFCRLHPLQATLATCTWPLRIANMPSFASPFVKQLNMTELQAVVMEYKESNDAWWQLSNGILCFFMQAGFGCVTTWAAIIAPGSPTCS